MQQREEKQLDMFLENSLIKLADLKKTIAHMIQKIGKFRSTFFQNCHFIVFFSNFRVRTPNNQLAGILGQLRFNLRACK